MLEVGDVGLPPPPPPANSLKRAMENSLWERGPSLSNYPHGNMGKGAVWPCSACWCVKSGICTHVKSSVYAAADQRVCVQA